MKNNKKKRLNDRIISLGFLLEVTLFLYSGYNIGTNHYLLGIIIGLLGFFVALFVGELIRIRGSVKS